MALIPALQEAKTRFTAVIANHQLGGEAILVKVDPLTTEQAIGNPVRKDFPLLEGKEVMVEARFRGGIGHAFTSQPGEFEGTIDDVLNLGLDTDNNRAIFVSTLNAVVAHLGLTSGVGHCRDDEPEQCWVCISAKLRERFGLIKVGMVGYQPALLENLVKTFDTSRVRCSDLNPRNVGSARYGVEIWNGNSENRELAKWCDLLLVTSSTMVNNTFDSVRRDASSEGKSLIVFGVSGAGISTLLELERICPFGH
ncbi:Rossmann-like domain-containing protein [Chloroflexota bacterium]